MYTFLASVAQGKYILLPLLKETRLCWHQALFPTSRSSYSSHEHAAMFKRKQQKGEGHSVQNAQTRNKKYEVKPKIPASSMACI